MMDKALLRFYRERWKEVYEVEAREQAALSTEEKLGQVSVLMEFARAVQRERPPDYQVIERWRRLRERLCGLTE